MYANICTYYLCVCFPENKCTCVIYFTHWLNYFLLTTVCEHSRRDLHVESVWVVKQAHRKHRLLQLLWKPVFTESLSPLVQSRASMATHTHRWFPGSLHHCHFPRVVKNLKHWAKQSCCLFTMSERMNFESLSGSLWISLSLSQTYTYSTHTHRYTLTRTQADSHLWFIGSSQSILCYLI